VLNRVDKVKCFDKVDNGQFMGFGFMFSSGFLCKILSTSVRHKKVNKLEVIKTRYPLQYQLIRFMSNACLNISVRPFLFPTLSLANFIYQYSSLFSQALMIMGKKVVRGAWLAPLWRAAIYVKWAARMRWSHKAREVDGLLLIYYEINYVKGCEEKDKNDSDCLRHIAQLQCWLAVINLLYFKIFEL